MMNNLETFDGKTQKAELPEFMTTVHKGTSVKNFTYQGFDDFGAVAIVPTIAQPEMIEFVAPVSQPIFTVEDMELAKTLARDEGMQIGREAAAKDFVEGAAAAEVEEKVKAADLLEKIHVELSALNSKTVENSAAMMNEINGLAIAIAKKVCGAVSAKLVEDEVNAVIGGLEGKLDEGETVKIYLNAENIAGLNAKFTNASLNEDNKIAAGDFRVEWRNGFAEKNLTKLWRTIEEVCARKSEIEVN